MDYVVLPPDDLALNARVFHWPENIEAVFDLSHSRLRHRRAAAEEALGTRLESFAEKLDEYNKALEAFKKKDSPVLNMEEMKSNVDTLNWLGEALADAKQELFDINEEERLLEWEISPFRSFAHMISFKDPYDKLWRTAYDFHVKYERLVQR
ncbi:dynein heavy chain 3, axonemal-like [Pollicipes pollicipes]|uniref:dynein heavy chain 3, axonemal-like n=1 Tax=Pollicipes pollicipes TaxID=41117 RepID=UPI001884A04C|nr:dynein heavy chain 3, axonemal-like [Pollicipes pollicipes]